MSFNTLVSKVARVAISQVKNKDSIVDFGNQRYKVAKDERIQNIDSVEEFYKHFGFNRYVALDINTKFGSIIMDLNVDLKQAGYTEQFDLVANVGTGEHLFDQGNCIRNMHNLCEEGGIIFCVLPTYGWVNHGFFNIQPNLFRDLAYVNNYEILHTYMGDPKGGNLIELFGHEAFEQVKPKRAPNPIKKAIEKCLVKNDIINAMFCIVMRKNEDKDFCIPIQKRYVSDIEDTNMKEDYGYDIQQS